MTPAPEPAEQGDDGKLDLRTLAASMSVPPPEPATDASGAATPTSGDAASIDAKAPDSDAPEEKPAKKPAATAHSPSRESSQAAVEKTRPSEPATEIAPPARSGGSGMWIGIGVGAALAAAAVFFIMNGHEEQAGGTLASSAPTSVDSVDDGDQGVGRRRAIRDVEDESGLYDEEPTADDDQAADDLEADEEIEGTDEPGAAEATGADVEAEVERTPSGETATASPSAAAQPPSERSEEPGSRRGETARSAARAESPATPAGSATASARQPASATAAPQQGQAPAQSEARSIDSMLDQALGGRPNREGTGVAARPTRGEPASAAGGSADLPETPSREDVGRTLARLLPQVRQCAGDQVGIANATILLRGDGTVGSVVIGGSPFGGTPQGACMEGVIRNTQFPRFRAATFRMVYPFAIR